MIRAIRFLAAAAVLAFVPMAVRVLAVEPWKCNAQRLRTQQYIDTWYSSPRRADVVIQTREHLASNLACEPYCAANASMYMQRGALLRMLDRNDDAKATYLAMLRHHQRPEIYLELALLELFEGDRERAVVTLMQAIRFAPSITNSNSRQWGRWLALPELSGIEDEAVARLRREDPNFDDYVDPWY